MRGRHKAVEKTPEEKAKLLAESVALQRIDNAGAGALKTLKVILQNTAKEDPKFRQLRKSNATLQRKVVAVPGALPLLLVGAREGRQVDGGLRGGGRHVRDEEPRRCGRGESVERDRGVSVVCLLREACMGDGGRIDGFINGWVNGFINGWVNGFISE